MTTYFTPIMVILLQIIYTLENLFVNITDLLPKVEHYPKVIV